MAAKRADDFEAGARVIWDFDPIDGCVRVDRDTASDSPVSHSRGPDVDAEAAVPAWLTERAKSRNRTGPLSMR